jgi:outer membrane protein assembly factor BamB
MQWAWSFNAGAPVQYVAIDNGAAFFMGGDGSQQEVTAVSLATGDVLWHVPLSDVSDSNSSLTVDNGKVFVVYVGSSGQSSLAVHIAAMDEGTGNGGWDQTLGSQSEPTPPVASDGVVYETVNAVNGSSTQVFAVHESDGAIAWDTSPQDGTLGPVTLAGGWVLAGSAAPAAYAFDPLTGSQAWFTSHFHGRGTPDSSSDGSRIWVENNTPDSTCCAQEGIFSTRDGSGKGQFGGWAPSFAYGEQFQAVNDGANALKIVASDPTTGAVHWSYDEYSGRSSQTFGSLPLAADGYIFVESQNGDISALDRASGRTVWGVDTMRATQGSWGSDIASLAAGDGYLVVPAGDYILAFKGSGQPPPTPPGPPTADAAATTSPGGSNNPSERAITLAALRREASRLLSQIRPLSLAHLHLLRLHTDATSVGMLSVRVEAAARGERHGSRYTVIASGRTTLSRSAAPLILRTRARGRRSLRIRPRPTAWSIRVVLTLTPHTPGLAPVTAVATATEASR